MHNNQVFIVLRLNKIYVKMTKCHFEEEKLQYLGHVVGNKSIKVHPRKIETMTKRHKPLEIGKLRYFLGFCN